MQIPVSLSRKLIVFLWLTAMVLIGAMLGYADCALDGTGPWVQTVCYSSFNCTASWPACLVDLCQTGQTELCISSCVNPPPGNMCF